jgi:serine-type D-Ala-D-Ala carboxypeptidase/endopeptidase (penicillin-binding protein 4)
MPISRSRIAHIVALLASFPSLLARVRALTIPYPLSPISFLLVSCLCTSSPACARETALPPAVARAIQSFAIPAHDISIYVRDANTNEVVVEHEADESRSPASTIKVLTTFAALDMLGPSYTWKTRAYINGALANGVLKGDLVLVGGGDPYMTAERWWSFVQDLRERGLAKITGDVIVDNSYFATGADSRADFDAQPFRTYNVLPDALMVNFQTSRFTLTASDQRSRPLITANPLPANLQIDNRVRIVPGKCQRDISFDMPDPNEPSKLVISGTLAASCGSYSISRAIMTAPDFAYGTFHTLWTQSGGAIGGAGLMGVVPKNARLLYEHDSLPLPEIIRLVNKYSNNVMARHLLLTLGAERFGAPATLEGGRQALRAWLSARGIDVPGLVIENGSGLSRAERITARGLGEMLDLAWHSPFMPEFAASLPLSATDGTLRNRFNATGMQGRIRLKTGRLDDVSALAGFVNAASGKTFVVVIFVNHTGAHRGSGEAIQSELVRWVFGQ